MSYFKDVLAQAKANQKPRITPVEYEALVKLINHVNAYFTDEINYNPEAATWELHLQVDIHFDARLVKAFEAMSSDFPEIKFDLLTPHVLIFSLDRSDLEAPDLESPEPSVEFPETSGIDDTSAAFTTSLTKLILTSINDFGFVELHAHTSTTLERFQNIAQKHNLNIAQADETRVFMTSKVTHAN